MFDQIQIDYESELLNINEVFIDNHSEPCNKRTGDTEEPFEPDPAA